MCSGVWLPSTCRFREWVTHVRRESCNRAASCLVVGTRAAPEEAFSQCLKRLRRNNREHGEVHSFGCPPSRVSMEVTGPGDTCSCRNNCYLGAIRVHIWGMAGFVTLYYPPLSGSLNTPRGVLIPPEINIQTVSGLKFHLSARSDSENVASM